MNILQNALHHEDVMLPETNVNPFRKGGLTRRFHMNIRKSPIAGLPDNMTVFTDPQVHRKVPRVFCFASRAQDTFALKSVFSGEPWDAHGRGTWDRSADLELPNCQV